MTTFPGHAGQPSLPLHGPEKPLGRGLGRNTQHGSSDTGRDPPEPFGEAEKEVPSHAGCVSGKPKQRDPQGEREVLAEGGKFGSINVDQGLVGSRGGAGSVFHKGPRGPPRSPHPPAEGFH